MSNRASGYERDPLDWYVEPGWVTEALLAAEPFVGDVWDPACGLGNIVIECRKAGLYAGGSDIADRGANFGWFSDFLADDFVANCDEPDNIITNPPYRHALDFTLKAIELARQKAAIFVPVAFLTSQKRAATLYGPHPPSRILYLADRPSCPPGAADVPARGGTTDYCWIVWNKTHVGPTTVGWLRKPAKEPA